MTENQKKIMQIHELLMDVDDILVSKFFDLDSEELLDLKISVLTQLKNGVPPKDIPEYYSILELYPADGEVWE
jgi:hypothetical protein